jgi:AraC-like DNA-binding protein
MSTDEAVPTDGTQTYRLPPITSVSHAAGAPESDSRSQGLWRTTLAGPGHTLAEAFANLERSPQVERLVRHAKRDLVGARVTLTPEEGEGYWELTRIRDDFYVIIMNFRYTKARFELVPGDGLIQFNFRVSGDMTLAAGSAEPLRFNCPSVLVWAQSPGVDINEWTAPRAHERMIAISIRPEFLVEHFLTSTVDLPLQLQSFLSNACGIGYCQLPLTADMFSVADKLINNPSSGKLDLLYTEALTLELLCAAVRTFCSSPAANSGEFTERMLRCLQATRNLLMRELASPPTIQQLARIVGMSQTALTKGFKALYGETVGEFALRCRMERAMKLLLDEQKSVDEVSELVGYSHPTSFSTSFRHHFGIRPLAVRFRKSQEGRTVRQPAQKSDCGA